MQKILIFGGSGPIGSNLVKLLGPNVFAPPHYDCDCLNEGEVLRVFYDYQPTHVYLTCGFNGGILFNKTLPLTIYERTCKMTLNVIHAACSFKVQKLLYPISSCAYPDELSNEPLREEDFLKGMPHDSITCHGFAKRAMYVALLQAQKQYGLRFVCPVFNNCYGNHQTFNPEKTKVADAMIKRLVDAKKEGLTNLVLFGSGNPRRELLYARDAAEACIFAMEHCDGLINFGSGVDISIKELAEKIAKLSGFKGTLSWDITKPDGQMRKILNINKMLDLGWYPPTSLDTGLLETIRYYETNF